MATRTIYALLAAVCFSAALAADHSPLQDFCVADKSSTVNINGMTCKDPKTVQASDFHFTGLHIAANTSNRLGFRSTPVNVTQLPGLNTLGISMARLDLAPWGVNPPHSHPRASEIITVLDGTIEVGFVTSNPENRLMTKVLNKGDVFVFPKGLIHYQRNVGPTHAASIGAFSSQNPGAVTIANAVFGSNAEIASDILAKAFRLDHDVVAHMQTKF